MLKRFFLLLILLFVYSCAISQEQLKRKERQVKMVKLVNASNYNVYGHYRISDTDATVGVIAAGGSVSLDIESFPRNQAIKIYFRCDKADLFDCATHEADVGKYYPIGDYESVTAVFTFKKMGVILMSFEVINPAP
jgi:hypothetical protein